jgi:hypothetical protein
MTTTWEAIDDDKLTLADKTVDFLQSEFCPAGVDAIWSEDYLKWKLSNINPAGSGHLSVALSNNRVIGTVSLTRKRILINGTEYLGGEVGDSYSSSSFRRRTHCSTLSAHDSNPDSYLNKSIFGRLASDVRARAEENGVSIIYGTPNKNAYPSWTKRLGYFDLKSYDNRSYVRPTLRFVTGKLPLLKPLCGVMYATEALLLNVSKLVYLNKNIKNFSFEERTPSEEEINHLWDEVKPSIGFSLVRDAAYWVHRYLKHPLASYSVFSICENEKIAGLVVTRKVTTGTGKVIVYVVEWMINDANVPLEYVLFHLIHRYRKGELDALTFYASGSLFEGKSSLKHGFVKRNRVPIIFANNEGAQVLKTLDNDFQFFVGSSDAV